MLIPIGQRTAALIAALVSTGPLKAAASWRPGTVALGSGDADAARRHFEDDVDDANLESGATFKLGRASLELAWSLVGSA